MLTRPIVANGVSSGLLRCPKAGEVEVGEEQLEHVAGLGLRGELELPAYPAGLPLRARCGAGRRPAALDHEQRQAQELTRE